MKFLCDRCKTRYSIGDDRVRGKILKIRCKNCANVITVREGMTVDEDLGRGRPTTQAPLESAQPASAGGALASAFAQQMTKPPPALEEEWYVSIDGQQAGPFGLAAAQRWVASKPFEAELHCWSEGFDDWLPVDKVSHFRGLRKKPAPAPAPPAAQPPPRPRPEDEPKPLFAATMASLERAATAQGGAAINMPSKSASAQVPAIPAIPAVVPKPASGPTNGVAAKANGTAGSTRIPTAVGTPGNAAKANGAAPTPGQSALAAAFDVSGPAEVGGAVESEPFGDLRGSAAAANPAPEPAADDDDDNLEIGEVSRVVNLADLARSHQKKVAAAAAPGMTGPMPRASVGRMTGSAPRLDVAHGGLDATASVDALPPAPSGLAGAPVVAQAHRRGLIMLIGVAAVLLAGVTVALVLILNSGDGGDDTSLGPTAQAIDTSRPDEIVRLHMQPPTEGSAAPHVRHTGGQIVRPNVPNTPETPDTPGAHLQPEEIEDMAQKNSTGTQRCYMRAQRGEMGLELGDLKKISVTLVVDKTGAVDQVQLSDHANDSLGACLTNQIKRWKFRESSGGQFRIVLAFANG